MNLESGGTPVRRPTPRLTGAIGGQEPFSFEQIVGVSAPLREAIETARLVARAKLTTVLLVGETGTGKELFARGIHCGGANSAAPFVAVNCAAIPESLLESELFGHEAGAFTSAQARKHGLMELAGCGTLFLDEMHHLPPLLQPKLLRALEERRIRRLGGSTEINIECRIVAATNVAIEDSVEAGTFREDLFYRLNVLRVDIPPLRDRPEDLELLAHHFLQDVARAQGAREKGLAPDAVIALREHRWPGNVRELRNVIERAVVLSGDEPAIRAAHLLIQQRTARVATPPQGVTGPIAIPRGGTSLAEIEREAAQLTLQLTGGNRSRAARLLGISRPTLARILRDVVPLFGEIEEAS
ncbi:MAG: sigma 54-interacting transcriptional regulator [Gemmatimonadaceae bacterium]|nr:sigma 54-interacting transcriptional regulator [Gemmatimonadaceae bacterium]